MLELIIMNINIDFKKIKVVSFYSLIFLLLYGLTNHFNDMDYDIWVRLIAGKHVVQTGSVMYKDILSYTPTHTWYDPEWLSSAFLYLIIIKFGILSITMIKFLLVFLSFVGITVGAVIVAKSKFSSLCIEYFLYILILQFFGGSSGFFLRCQLFTYAILPIWIILLEKINQNYETKKSLPYLISLPILMLLWLNIHGGCIAGVGIMVLYIIGRILNRKPVKKYLLAFIPVSGVFVINPWGIEYIKFLIDSAFLDRSWIIEWLSVFSGNIMYANLVAVLMLILMLLFVLGLIIKKFKDINYSKIIILVVTFCLGCAHFKHSQLFAIVAGIYLYEDYLYIKNKISNYLFQKIKLNDIYKKYLDSFKVIIAYVVIFAFALYYVFISPASDSVLKMSLLKMPLNVIEFINVNEIKGNMFLPYFYGSFMAYKTYPNIKIFMDGREEQVYDYDLFDREMFFMHGLFKDSKPIVEEYPPDLYLVEIGWNYRDYVVNHPGYKLIFTDGQFELYIKKDLAKDNYKQIHLQEQFQPDKLLETKIDFRKNKNK